MLTLEEPKIQINPVDFHIADKRLSLMEVIVTARYDYKGGPCGAIVDKTFSLIITEDIPPFTSYESFKAVITKVLSEVFITPNFVNTHVAAHYLREMFEKSYGLTLDAALKAGDLTVTIGRLAFSNTTDAFVLEKKS